MLPNSIEGLIALGAVIGLIMGWFNNRPKMGAVMMLVFALSSFALAVVEFKLNYTDDPSSTASLVIAIIPFCLCLGAFGGWFVGFYLRSLITR